MRDDYDRPSRAEAEADARADRADAALERRRDDAARARGEYVPSDPMRWTRTTLAWYCPDATAVREGVFWLPGATDETVAALTARYGTRFETKLADDGVWVRTDPLLEAPPYDAGPATVPDVFWAQDVADDQTTDDTRRTA